MKLKTGESCSEGDQTENFVTVNAMKKNLPDLQKFGVKKKAPIQKLEKRTPDSKLQNEKMEKNQTSNLGLWVLSGVVSIIVESTQ